MFNVSLLWHMWILLNGWIIWVLVFCTNLFICILSLLIAQERMYDCTYMHVCVHTYIDWFTSNIYDLMLNFMYHMTTPFVVLKNSWEDAGLSNSHLLLHAHACTRSRLHMLFCHTVADWALFKYLEFFHIGMWRCLASGMTWNKFNTPVGVQWVLRVQWHQEDHDLEQSSFFYLSSVHVVRPSLYTALHCSLSCAA